MTVVFSPFQPYVTLTRTPLTPLLSHTTPSSVLSGEAHPTSPSPMPNASTAAESVAATVPTTGARPTPSALLPTERRPNGFVPIPGGMSVGQYLAAANEEYLANLVRTMHNV